MRQCLFLCCLLLTVCCPQAFAAHSEYTVGEGDMLKITVYDHPDLTTAVRVTAEGSIRFPLIGQVTVGGLTAEQVSERLTVALADGYLVDPQVAVMVDEFRSQRAIIMGQVVKPGLYELRGSISFLELLSMAGGLSREAGDRAVVKRAAPQAGADETILTVDLKRLMRGGDTSLDLAIEDGDSVYIGEAGVFYVTGEVKKADAYKYEEDTTVIKAITMAGGFTAKAAKGRVKIIRKVEGEEVVLEKVDMHEPIRTDDVVVVPESFF